jgi:hypothetical protein
MPCRDDANRFTATAALWLNVPLICGQVRIHTWFSAGCCWSCVTPGSHLPLSDEMDFRDQWILGQGGIYLLCAPGGKARRGPVCPLAAGVLYPVQHAPLAARPYKILPSWLPLWTSSTVHIHTEQFFCNPVPVLPPL